MKKIGLLSLILITISSVVIMVFGNTYKEEFQINKKYDYEFVLENRTGEVEVIKSEEIGDKYVIKVKAKKPGKVEIGMDYGSIGEKKILYIHKNMVITEDSYFGRSTCSEVLPISISIILIYSLYLLIKRYRESVKDNLYQYKNIAYLGIIIFLSFFTLDNIISIFNYRGIYRTVGNIINSMSTLSMVLFPIALVTFILVTISNIKLIMREGKSLRNLLGLFIGIFICLLTLLPDLVYKWLMKSQIINIYNLNGPGPYIYNFVESLAYLVVAYLECVLIGTIWVAIKSVRKKLEYNKDYMIILGCQIRKDGSLTPLLKGRVDKAIEFRNKQYEANKKDLVFIPSGGKGNDEVISEAEAIRNYLLKNGIKDKNIILENKSKNTLENIRNSYKLIKNKNANIAFSTTNYHVFRAGLLASEEGIKAEGVGSKTKSYFWINAFIREFIGTLYAERKKHIIVFSTIILVIAIMITITYFANNI